MVLKSAVRRRLTRAERVEDTKNRILAAGIEVVGKLGYSESSIALITQHAEVAQGTFYNYFESRQDLLDQLLPHLGKKLLEFIREKLVDIKDGLERERVGFVAFFEFVAKYPSFFRIFHEAEIFAPKGYESHMANMADGYMRALSRSLRQGTISGYSERELELITFILLASRDFVGKRYTQSPAGFGVPPAWVVDTYMKFLRFGLVRTPTLEEYPSAQRTSEPGRPRLELSYEAQGRLAGMARTTLSAADCLFPAAALAQIAEEAALHILGVSGGCLISTSFSCIGKLEPGTIEAEVRGVVGQEPDMLVTANFMQGDGVVAVGLVRFGKSQR